VTGVLVLNGPNFSGRSGWLAARRWERRWPDTVLIGPYPEAALTGLAWRVHEELALANGGRDQHDGLADRLGLGGLLDREIHVLSGGETVRTALAAVLLGAPRELQIDVALEQLDAGWRDTIVALLEERAAAMTIALADNRLDTSELRQVHQVVDFPLQPEGRTDIGLSPHDSLGWLRAEKGSDIRVDGLCFKYRRSLPDVLSGVSLELPAGTLSLLQGPNGAGKTTFVRLLSGTLVPQQGDIRFGDEPFRPKRSSRRFAALAFQNPDYQWTGLTVADEIRRSGVDAAAPLSAVCEAFGIPPSVLQQNPVDLPFAIKKRLGVAVCFLAAKPWLIFDEPTLGQDADYCRAFSECLLQVTALRRSVIVITHDPRLVAHVPRARRLLVHERSISLN
jgi:energy-coupling factor transport system ATP-binding protein